MEIGAFALRIADAPQGQADQVVEGAPLELAPGFFLAERGIEQPMVAKADRDLRHVATQHLALQGNAQGVLFLALGQQQRRDRLQPIGVSFSEFAQHWVVAESFTHVFR